MQPKKVNRNLAPTLLALPDDVDFIRFEKNLLQIGFFGAQDTRHATASTRRIEQTVSRDGQRLRVAAEFRSSDLGLPSTADRDKFLAFMKIAGEERAKTGRVTNPVRFTGYRILKELGHTICGENYEDINRWGRRMADTTITSERVIYFAARKRYSDDTIHVFRTFRRIGESDLSGGNRDERFEVVLEDWLLENLNQSYVVPEDFTAYKQLKRPTAKGIFGYLHLWFHASRGLQVEKDYFELCADLNIPSYPHVSKIRDTMGRSLDDLIGIQYLSRWDVQPMTSKEGYKLVLWPGDQLMRVLAIAQKKQLPASGATPNAEPGPQQQEAINALVACGVSLPKAIELATHHDPMTITDQAEYVSAQKTLDKRGKIENPAGLLIYTIENNLPVPADFVTSRRRKVIKDEELKRQQEREEQDKLYLQYEQWRDASVQAQLTATYPGQELDRKLAEIAAQRSKTDPFFQRVAQAQRIELALQLLRKELRENLQLRTFEEWQRSNSQPRDLFSEAGHPPVTAPTGRPRVSKR
jgi:hypothetical protein